MKYIRTKCGIIEVNPTLTNEQIDISQGKETPRADTIEELCDYVFFKDWEGKLQIQKMFGGNKQIKHLLFNGATEIKLAILTDKGLIYVAEINDKGELELL